MKKYLISEMDKEMKDKIKIKAEAFNLSIDELIVESINDYNMPINCLKCHSSQVTYVTHEQSIRIGKDDVNVKIENLPTMMCATCNCTESAVPDPSESEAFVNVRILVLMMKQIEVFIIEEKYKKKKSNVNEFVFDFNELIKIKLN